MLASHRHHRLSPLFRVFFTVFLITVLSVGKAQDANKITLDVSDIEKLAEQAAKEAVQKAVAKLKKAEEAEAKATQAVDEKMKSKGISVAEKAPSTLANKTRLVSIGSGSVGGNYFVLGELVGGVISHPAGSLPCGKGGTCGVMNTQSVNLTSAGSMANLASLSENKITTGFVQSDVAYWAYTGTGLFENKEKMADLRAIASLYPEAVHIVINKKAGINSVADLKGKRVSAGARKSGTLSLARLVLDAYSLTEDDLAIEYLNNQQSIEKLTEGKLDAMFFSVGAPAPALTQLFTSNKDFTLLSIDNAAQQKIFDKGAYFSPYKINEQVYPNVGETSTISVFALWLCSAKQKPELVYQMTKALWSDSARHLFNSSYIGKAITVDNSLQGIGIPLHDGAKKYYNEIGKRF